MSKIMHFENVGGGSTYSLKIGSLEDKKVSHLPLKILFSKIFGKNAKVCHCEAITECNRRSNPIKHENNEIATLHSVARNDKVSCLQLLVSRKDDKTSYPFAQQTVNSLPSCPPTLLPS